MKKVKNKAKKSEVRSHIGPGKKIISIYLPKDIHPIVKKRAAELRMSVSKYMLHLSQVDIKQGGGLIITPSTAPGAPDKK